MPSATARRIYEDQIPPFMSVFDLDAETITDRETVTLVDPKMVDMEPKAPAFANPTQQTSHVQHDTVSQESTHKHNGSDGTRMSTSAESSPTTTLSTTDSSPLSDPSPSSSPDSPLTLIPLNNYPATSFGAPFNTKPMQDAGEMSGLERPMTSPSPRRPRNMKGLFIQPPPAVTTTATSLVSEPASPSFIKPKIPAMKRKPSQLSLKTGSSDLRFRTLPEVPPSPAMPPILQRRALKHSTSSPHMRMGGMKSSTFGPAGGMTFPKVLERNESGLSEVLRPMKSSMNPTFDMTIMEEDSPIKAQVASRVDYESHNQSVHNEDLKTPGYPEGPIAIYSDSVFLYSEPTAEQASQFDVVINVAHEVKNPFDIWRQTHTQPTPVDQSPIPDTAVTTASFSTAFEYQPSEGTPIDTPTTPKAMPFQIPEYIHIPWDHNTDIAPDLLRLCETIDERTKSGKRVLIHCQQGASRSASLIIAYGLYQQPHLTVNDAYYAAQTKSRWISPNMKLMYSLQDFQKQMSQSRPLAGSTYRTGRSPTKHRLTLSADAIETAPKEPRTAPLPGQEGGSMMDEDSNRPRGNSTPGPQPVQSGPASAPPGASFTGKVEEKKPIEPEHPAIFKLAELPQRLKPGQSRSAFDLSRAAGLHDDVPPTPGFAPRGGFGFENMRAGGSPKWRRIESNTAEREVTLVSAYPSDDALLSPRAETMTNNPLHETSRVAGMHFGERAPTPGDGLFSPRASMFPREVLWPFGGPPQFADPRSPATQGEAPIVRSIDDVL